MCNRQAFHEKWKSHHAHKHQRRAERYRHWAQSRGFGMAGQHPPVNVKELDDRYELHLYAPELANEDFKIALRDRILTISAETKQGEEDGTWKRREFSPGGFQRQFDLNEKIDVEAINAEYENGILKVSLPKLEGMETFRQDIPVA